VQVNQKNWSCLKKQKARCETIIAQYRKHFSVSLPADKQYWTMCGQCADTCGNQLLGCEVSQVIEQGLIIPAQFRGVEINPEIHTLNVAAFPKLTWINEDFYHAMVVANATGEFNAGMVNVDLPRTPDGGAAYVAKILAFLTATTNDVLVVANLIMRMKYYTAKDGDYVVNLLNEYPQFRYAMSEGNWTLVDGFYEYNGAGNTGSRTYMGSFVFIKGDI
jgi:hypothetical protein